MPAGGSNIRSRKRGIDIMEAIYYVIDHLNYLVFPAIFFIIRRISLKCQEPMKRLESIWLLFSGIVYGISWSKAAVKGFGYGLVISNIGNVLVVSLFYSFLAFLFGLADLLETQKILDREFREETRTKCAKAALHSIYVIEILICIFDIAYGIIRHYEGVYHGLAFDHGIWGWPLVLVYIVLAAAVYIGTPTCCYMMLYTIPIGISNELTNAFKKIEDNNREFDKALRQEFLDMLQRQYGIPASIVQIIQRGYTPYNIKILAMDQSFSFAYQKDYTELIRYNTPAQMVANEDRPRIILEHIAELMGYTNKTEDELHSAEWLLMRISETGKAYQPDGPCATAIHAVELKWPPQRFQKLKDFFQARSREIQEIAQTQLKYYANDYKGIRAGVDGEKEVRTALDDLGGWIIPLYNLLLEFMGPDGSYTTVEIDALVLAPNGIYALEVKNFGSYKSDYEIIVARDGSWYKEYDYWTENKGSPKREPMDNPFRQNARHTSYIEKFVNQYLGRTRSNWIFVEGIVVLANDKVSVRVEFGAPQSPTRIGTLCNRLRQNKETVLSEDEIQRLANAFISRNLPSHEYPLYDHRDEIFQLSKTCESMLEMATNINQGIEACLKDHPEFEKLV